MNNVARLLLCCFLAVALAASGVPAWGMGTAISQDAGTMPAEQGGDDMSDCHMTKADAPNNSASGDPSHECCDEGEACEHDSCRCLGLGLALSMALPVRSSGAMQRPGNHPAWTLSTPSPQSLIASLLRPPRA